MDESQSSLRSFFGRFLPGAKSKEKEERPEKKSPSPRENAAPKAGPPENFSKNGGSSSLDPSNRSKLRYLSPTAVESSFATTSQARSERATMEECLASQSRKRNLREPNDSLDVESIFQPDYTVKRFRATSANISLLPDTYERSYCAPPRLDVTWSGQAASESPSMMTHSPGGSSIRSLRSRISRVTPSNASALSSRTAAILGAIEKISTPVQDVRRMPLLRMGVEKERWAPLANAENSSLQPTQQQHLQASAPPLSRLSSSLPSRAHILSSVIASAQRKPYWRDVSRRGAGRSPPSAREGGGEETVVEGGRDRMDTSNTAKEKEPSTVLNATHLSSIFDTAAQRKSRESGANGEPTRKKATVLKGPDGSDVNQRRNQFSANFAQNDEDDEVNASWMSSIRGIPEGVAVPKAGFLSDSGVFSFVKPILRQAPPSPPTKPVEKITREKSSSESCDIGDESSAGESDSEGTASDASDSSAEAQSKTKKDNSGETTSSHESGKENSQKQAVSSTPFGTLPKPNGSALSKLPAGFSFGANQPAPMTSSAAANVQESAAPKDSSEKALVKAEPTTWECPDCLIVNKATSAKCVACGHVWRAAPASSSQSEWDCTECFVHNKATDAKCICCENPRLKDDKTASSSSVFGDKAFKPTTTFPASKVSFGFGGQGASSTAASGSATTLPFSFGFGAAAAAKAPAKEETAKAVSSFAVPVSATSSSAAVPSLPVFPSFGLTETKPAATTGTGLTPIQEATKQAPASVAPQGFAFTAAASAASVTPAASVAPSTAYTSSSAAAAPLIFGTPSSYGGGAGGPSTRLFTGLIKPSIFLSKEGVNVPSSAAEPKAPQSSAAAITTTNTITTTQSKLVFGSSAPSTVIAPSFGTSGLPSAPAFSAPSSNLFGNPKSSTFGTTSAASSTASPFTLQTAAVPSVLGAPSSSLSVPPSLLGSTSAPKPVFQMGGDTNSIFGGIQKPAATASNSGRVDEGPASKRPMNSFFGAAATSSTPAPGASASSSNLFGMNVAAPAANAGSSTLFGSSSSSNLFGAAAASAPAPFNPQPAAPMFSAPTGALRSEFHFGSAPAATSSSLFQFGASNTNSNSTSAPAPAAPIFGGMSASPFGSVPSAPSALGAPAPPTMFPTGAADGGQNAFAYNSGAPRKTAVAKRRLLNKGGR